MSEPYNHLQQRPRAPEGSMPVYTQGNWFWKGNSRFLIKGISYYPREPDSKVHDNEALVDPLSDQWLPQLRQDIPLFQQLGINTIYISKFDPGESHDDALDLLQTEGIHVLIKLFKNFQPLSKDPLRAYNTDWSTLDPLRLYTPSLLKRNLAIIDATADHPNVLGYSISANILDRRPALKLSAVLRSAVRDTKRYLQLRCKRQIPVGVALPHVHESRGVTLEVFTAGEPEERVDFYSFECFSWVGDHSSFRVSGYENMVNHLADIRVPMFFSGYGAAQTHRGFSEVDCLYSPDMTGVFSGGVVYSFAWAPGNFNVVDIDADGRRIPKDDFWAYRKRLDDIAKKGNDEVIGQHSAKDYEGWRGNVPGQVATWGTNAGQIPACPVDLEAWSKADARS